MRKQMIIALALGLLLEQAHAQQSNWQNLEKIRPGDQVQVVGNRLRAYSGEFVAYSENDLTLRALGNTIVVPREEVHRITILSRGRGRHIARGFLFGAGIGAGIMAPFAAKYASCNGCQGGAYVATGALIGGGVGALVGAGKRPHLDIYRSSVKPKK